MRHSYYRIYDDNGDFDSYCEHCGAEVRTVPEGQDCPVLFRQAEDRRVNDCSPCRHINVAALQGRHNPLVDQDFPPVEAYAPLTRRKR